MALLQECPVCKKRFSLERESCRCGFKMKKSSGKSYWIEYYQFGRRRRERIGPNKEAAQQRLREVLKARTEERYIDKDPAVRLALGDLCRWYLDLAEVKKKDSYVRDTDMIENLNRILGEGTKIKDITQGKMESYRQKRLEEKSSRRLGQNIQPSTVNKEANCLKAIFNRAVRHGVLKNNPLSGLKGLQENNIRMRILSPQEFERLLVTCPPHIRPIIEIAYFMGLRQGEILHLTWREVDLAAGFIRLPAGMTKTDQGRSVPIHPRVRETLSRLPRGLHTARVFLFRGEPFGEFKYSYRTACRKAGIKDFTFHDLRHCALNNLRLAGNDYFKIMAASGHKTMSCFKRYNLVTEEELATIKWTPEGEKTPLVATNIDTKQNSENSKIA